MTYSDLVAAITHLRTTNRFSSRELMKLQDRSRASVERWNAAMRDAWLSPIGYDLAA